MSSDSDSDSSGDDPFSFEKRSFARPSSSGSGTKKVNLNNAPVPQAQSTTYNNKKRFRESVGNSSNSESDSDDDDDEDVSKYKIHKRQKQMVETEKEKGNDSDDDSDMEVTDVGSTSKINEARQKEMQDILCSSDSEVEEVVNKAPPTVTTTRRTRNRNYTIAVKNNTTKTANNGSTNDTFLEQAREAKKALERAQRNISSHAEDPIILIESEEEKDDENVEDDDSVEVIDSQNTGGCVNDLMLLMNAGTSNNESDERDGGDGANDLMFLLNAGETGRANNNNNPSTAPRQPAPHNSVPAETYRNSTFLQNHYRPLISQPIHTVPDTNNTNLFQSTTSSSNKNGSSGKLIQIKIQTGLKTEHATLKFKLRMNDKFITLLDSIKNKYDISTLDDEDLKIYLMFDGELIKCDTQTPQMLDMEDGELIDMVVKKENDNTVVSWSSITITEKANYHSMSSRPASSSSSTLFSALEASVTSSIPLPPIAPGISTFGNNFTSIALPSVTSPAPTSAPVISTLPVQISSSPPPAIPPSTLINIKTITTGNVCQGTKEETWKLKHGESFQKLMDSYRSKNFPNVNASNPDNLKISFKYNDRQVYMFKTPASLGMKADGVEVIHVYVSVKGDMQLIQKVQQYIQPQNSQNNMNAIPIGNTIDKTATYGRKIKLKIRLNGNDSNLQELPIHLNEPFESLFHSYEKKNSFQEGSVKFTLDGDTLSKKTKPSDEDLEGGEILDAIIQIVAAAQESTTTSTTTSKAGVPSSGNRGSAASRVTSMINVKTARNKVIPVFVFLAIAYYLIVQFSIISIQNCD